ncbi:hypothetical protein PENSPDRAFT_758945 [Peniophora sp. CONT]|nr:hypothetical protein PENSPDRAFT_758945 [Peniophora sp. CONT]
MTSTASDHLVDMNDNISVSLDDDQIRDLRTEVARLRRENISLEKRIADDSANYKASLSDLGNDLQVAREGRKSAEMRCKDALRDLQESRAAREQTEARLEGAEQDKAEAIAEVKSEAQRHLSKATEEAGARFEAQLRSVWDERDKEINRAQRSEKLLQESIDRTKVEEDRANRAENSLKLLQAQRESSDEQATSSSAKRISMLQLELETERQSVKTRDERLRAMEIELESAKTQKTALSGMSAQCIWGVKDPHLGGLEPPQNQRTAEDAANLKRAAGALAPTAAKRRRTGLISEEDLIRHQLSLLDLNPCPSTLMSLTKDLFALDLPADLTGPGADYMRSPIFQHRAAFAGLVSRPDFLSFFEPDTVCVQDMPGGDMNELVFRRPDLNPGLPVIPGQPGFIISTEKYGFGTADKFGVRFGTQCTSLFVGLPRPTLRDGLPCVHERWKYMGVYERVGDVRPMTSQEWRSLPQSVREGWAQLLYCHEAVGFDRLKGGPGPLLNYRFSRSLKGLGPPTFQEVQDQIEMVQALHICVIRPVGFNTEFLRELRLMEAGTLRRNPRRAIELVRIDWSECSNDEIDKLREMLSLPESYFLSF